MLASYIADIPESEYLPRIKKGSKTTTFCYIFKSKKHEFLSRTFKCQRNLLKTKALLADLSCFMKRSSEEDTLAELSMLSRLPVLYAIPIIGVHLSVDLYATFRFEPIHSSSLGLSRLLKEIF